MKCLFILCALTLAANLWGQPTVSAPRDRQKLLKDLEVLLPTEEPEVFAAMDRLKDPFRGPEPKVVASPVVAKTAKEEDEPPAAARLTDQQALELIAQQVRPVGSIVGGSSAFLNFSNGRRLERGTSFPAKIQDRLFSVELAEVTADSFTLRLGQAQVTRSIHKPTPTDGRIRVVEESSVPVDGLQQPPPG